MLINAPSFAKTEVVDYDPRLIIRYQFDGLDGVFRCGDRVFDVLEMQPIDFRQHTSERWGRLRQSWMDIAFLDNEDSVSVISFNKQSNVEMSVLFDLMNRNGVAIQSLWLALTAKSTPKKVFDGDEMVEGKYFVVDPFVEDGQEYAFVDYSRFEKAIAIKEKLQWKLIGEVL